MGSSPLARGLQGRGGGRVSKHRIIPARAGFTQLVRCAINFAQDHPRSRGVYPHLIWLDCMSVGSSPLARGLPSPRGASSEPERIIPARAGFTAWPAARSRTSWDHPRSRGVYTPVAAATSARSGSSPLARGLQLARLVGGGRHGIIPARAGFTQQPPARPGAPADHPRSRGVYGDEARAGGGICGSSPLARGLPFSQVK